MLYLPSINTLALAVHRLKCLLVKTFQQGALVFITLAGLVAFWSLSVPQHTAEQTRCDHKSLLSYHAKIEKQVKALKLSTYWGSLSSEEHF